VPVQPNKQNCETELLLSVAVVQRILHHPTRSMNVMLLLCEMMMIVRLIVR
jgi:hypothetical protein